MKNILDVTSVVSNRRVRVSFGFVIHNYKWSVTPNFIDMIRDVYCVEDIAVICKGRQQIYRSSVAETVYNCEQKASLYS